MSYGVISGGCNPVCFVFLLLVFLTNCLERLVFVTCSPYDFLHWQVHGLGLNGMIRTEGSTTGVIMGRSTSTQGTYR